MQAIPQSSVRPVQSCILVCLRVLPRVYQIQAPVIGVQTLSQIPQNEVAIVWYIIRWLSWGKIHPQNIRPLIIVCNLDGPSAGAGPHVKNMRGVLSDGGYDITSKKTTIEVV